MAITKAYEEVVDFIAAESSSASVIAFRPSEAARTRVFALVAREKAEGLSAAETAELEHYLEPEHLMRFAKANARQFLAEH